MHRSRRKVTSIDIVEEEEYFKEVAETLETGQITWELEQEIARRLWPRIS
jgi:hypothetical protein